MEPISTTAATIAAGAWFGNKLLGPTAEIIGEDLKQLYEKGKDRIVTNAIKKTKDIESVGQTNLRVSRDVFGMVHLLMKLYVLSTLVVF